MGVVGIQGWSAESSEVDRDCRLVHPLAESAAA
jgi:hypothetical protein